MHDIIQVCTDPYTPRQNGGAEKKNRTYIEMINDMLLHETLSFALREEALLTAFHIQYHIHLKKNKISPYEIGKGKRPNLGGISKCGGALNIARAWSLKVPNWVKGPSNVYL